MEQSNRIKPKLTHGHYVQQQHYLRQQVDPILSVKGDKGNTVLDMEEIEEIEQRQFGNMSPVRRPNDEQIGDFFENIDNIDVNIEETFSARQ